MKTVRLPTTGIDLEVSDNFHYQDDELVRSLALHTADLERKYGAKVHAFPWYVQAFESTPFARPFKKWSHEHQRHFTKGMCFVYHSHKSIDESFAADDGTVNAHTYVLDIFGEQERTFFKGHEETHILIHLNKLNQLKEAWQKNGVRAESLQTLPTEAICQIGGFYALLRKHPQENYSLQGIADDETFDIWSRWLTESGACKNIRMK